MLDFVEKRNWFQKKYRGFLAERYWTFQTALNLFLQRGGKNIVETGSVRMKDDWGGGMSTLLFGEIAKIYDKHLWTCDISPVAMGICKEITGEYQDWIDYVVADSIDFLHLFPQKVDLLYLDSMDCPEFDAPDSPNLIKSQEHQLKEINQIWKQIHDKTVILLDDNGFDNGGKPKLTKKFLEEKGWQCVMDNQQTLWIK